MSSVAESATQLAHIPGLGYDCGGTDSLDQEWDSLTEFWEGEVKNKQDEQVCVAVWLCMSGIVVIVCVSVRTDRVLGSDEQAG
jgi:hypothetical protein